MTPIKTKVELFNSYPGCYDFSEVKNGLIEVLERQVTDDEVYEHISMYIEEDYIGATAYLDEINDYWLCDFSIRLWNGTRERQLITDNIVNFITKFGTDCEYMRIVIEDDVLKIECSHHDGTNYAECRLLTNDGMDILRKFEEDCCDQDAEEQIESIFEELLKHTKKIPTEL